jgi:hypothetical protein
MEILLIPLGSLVAKLLRPAARWGRVLSEPHVGEIPRMTLRCVEAVHVGEQGPN